MKHKIGFRLDWLEMVLILVIVFVAGIFVTSQIDDKFICVGLLITGVFGILIKKRVKMPLRGNKTRSLGYLIFRTTIARAPMARISDFSDNYSADLQSVPTKRMIEQEIVPV